MNKKFKKTCLVCGKEFETNKSKQKYCTKECYEKHDREYMLIYLQTYNSKYKSTKKYKEKRTEYNKTYFNKNKNDINFIISNLCRQHVSRCIKREKNRHTFDILGYTSQDLREHLEKQFRDGMNWSNHGTLWHIDHIKPLCSFNFELPNGEVNYEEVKIANSLDNLQPLLIHENLSKGGKY